MSSNDYLSSTLQSIHETYANLLDTHVLNAVFPSLLLALVARNSNIILVTSHPAELQRSTAKILSTVFGLQTKRVKVRTPQSPRELLESLFLSTSPGSPSSFSHRQRSSRASLPRSVSAPRPPSSHFTEGSDSTAPLPAASRFPRHKTDPLPRNLDPQPSLRLPQVVVISCLERAGRTAQLALAEALRTRRITLDSIVWDIPDGFFVVYVSPTTDGYERPAIHLNLLDHFAFSIVVAHPAAPLSTSTPSPRLRSHSVSSPNRIPPLIPYNRLPRPESTFIPPLVSHYTSALFTAARHHPELDGTLLTTRTVKDATKLTHACAVLFREDEQNTISDVHVRRVVPPILAHRLRVRDGPREQIMGVLCPDAGIRNWGMQADKTQRGRRTIKAILTEIIREV